jgi:hypothetical protein
MAFIYDLVDTWNAGGTSFNAIKMNVTDTASAAASRLMTLQVGGAERFSVDKAGNVLIGNGGDLLISSATGGNNSTIYNDAQDLYIATNGSARMYFNSSGNVGIGNVSPGTRLDVTGNIRLSAGAPTIELNLGGPLIYSPASNTFAVGTGGGIGSPVERLRINSSGNVGIGTSTIAGGRMQINGQVSDTDGTGFDQGQLLITDSDNNTSSGLMLGYRWNAGVAEYARIQARNAAGATSLILQGGGGNVGIGTATPSERLDTGTGNTRTQALVISANQHLLYSADANTLGIRIGAAGPFYGIGTTGSSNMRFNNASGGDILFAIAGTERARIDASGNLSLGTTAGLARLRVAAGGTAAAPVLGNVTNYPAFISNPDPSYGLGIGVNPGDGRVWLQAQRSDSGTPAYNITLNEAGGNVGIGTSNPTGRLGVAVTGSRTIGTAWGASSVLVGSPGQFSGNLGFSFDTTNGGTIESAAPGVAAYPVRFVGSDVRFLTALTERVRIGSNGAFAIGGTGIDASLHIQQAYGGYDRLTQISPDTANKNAFNLMAAKNSGGGDLWWSWGVRNDNVWVLQQGVNYLLNSGLGFYYDSGGQAYKSGGGSWAAVSDARIKTNIAPISDAASRIMALKPSNFDYRAPEAHAGRVSDRGFIAQDFEEVYPHSVSESAMVADAQKAFVTGDNKIKAISLNNDFFADLVALVQDQQNTINDLRARMAELEISASTITFEGN